MYLTCEYNFGYMHSPNPNPNENPSFVNPKSGWVICRQYQLLSPTCFPLQMISTLCFMFAQLLFGTYATYFDFGVNPNPN